MLEFLKASKQMVFLIKICFLRTLKMVQGTTYCVVPWFASKYACTISKNSLYHVYTTSYLILYVFIVDQYLVFKGTYITINKK